MKDHSMSRINMVTFYRQVHFNRFREILGGNLHLNKQFRQEMLLELLI